MGFLKPVIDFFNATAERISSLSAPLQMILGAILLVAVVGIFSLTVRGGGKHSGKHGKRKGGSHTTPKGSNIPPEGDGGGACAGSPVFYGGLDGGGEGGGYGGPSPYDLHPTWMGSAYFNFLDGPSGESIQQRSLMEHARKSARFLQQHAAKVARYQQRKAQEKARYQAAHQNKVRSYQRKTKSGKTTTVRSHNRKSRRK